MDNFDFAYRIVCAMNDLWTLIFAALVLCAVMVLFIRLSIRMRRKGGSLTSMMYGATYEFYNQAHRAGIKEVVESRTDKKKKEQEAGDEPGEGEGYRMSKRCD
ncbi:hypothetical protein JXO59_10560 [candidate division KSB1 bacterium]|nr:hypothetical protein [candidate division KSB1 bacterium]